MTKMNAMKRIALTAVTLIMILTCALFTCGMSAQAAGTATDPVLTADYDMSAADYQEVLGYYYEIPETYRKVLEQYGWTIRFTNMTMDEAGEYDRQVLLSRYPNAKVSSTTHAANTTGITKYGTRTIYINKEITDSYGGNTTEQTLLHECGHAIDRVLYYLATGTDKNANVNTNYSDYDASFKPIFTAESANARSYAQSSSREYFADEFADYIMEGSAMAATFPQTYGFIAGVCNAYIK